jgi:hypothetical protein
MKLQKTLFILALVALTMTCTQASAAPLSSGWTSIGNAGTTTSADGVVTLPAGFAEYNFVSIRNEVIGNTLAGVNGNTVPGFNMATTSSTLNPLSTPIIAGAPEWSALGSISETCYDASCGFTGWISATYATALTGNYHLQLGVANVIDTKYQSGLTFAGTTIAGISIGPISKIPLPGAIWIMMSGLIGVLGLNRRKSATA